MINIGFFYAIITSFMFATMGIFTKLIYKYGTINADMLFLFSVFISCFCLFMYLLIKNKNFSFLKIEKKELVQPLICAGLFVLFLTNLSVLTSLEYIDVSIQKIITYANPFFIVLIHKFILGRSLNKQRIINILLILVGLILVVGKLDFSGTNITIGIFFAVISSLFVAIYSVLSEESKSTLEQDRYWFFLF